MFFHYPIANSYPNSLTKFDGDQGHVWGGGGGGVSNFLVACRITGNFGQYLSKENRHPKLQASVQCRSGNDLKSLAWEQVCINGKKMAFDPELNGLAHWEDG